MLYNQIEYCYTLFLCKHLCKRVFENNFYQDEKIVDLGFVFLVNQPVAGVKGLVRAYRTSVLCLSLSAPTQGLYKDKRSCGRLAEALDQLGYLIFPILTFEEGKFAKLRLDPTFKIIVDC